LIGCASGGVPTKMSLSYSLFLRVQEQSVAAKIVLAAAIQNFKFNNPENVPTNMTS